MVLEGRLADLTGSDLSSIVAMAFETASCIREKPKLLAHELLAGAIV
jgi:hypothetical protein